mgnify:CR=1 FL=1
MKFIGIIPARYASTRFPGKPLALLGGKPMIQRVYGSKRLDQSGDIYAFIFKATFDRLYLLRMDERFVSLDVDDYVERFAHLLIRLLVGKSHAFASFYLV